ncbi:hypothetical protein FRC02_003080 [Tulasnella sp. 418]|nr:hypothetical protein FRC02_003080 [Tulasnella sp. 418]
MSLRPPSTPSPGPNTNARASLQPQPRGSAAASSLAPISTRSHLTPGGRPTSELLGVGSTASFQTPEVEAIDQWFENLQNYEATLEEMAAASLDVNFKEELSAIEQWFRVLSEAERTAALYSLLQHSTQVQIRFFITVLQQMARSDPMTALLSPALGSSMQAQMESKLASMGLRSPGLPQSPAVRSFSASNSANRQSLGANLDPSSYLSPDAAVNQGGDAASTLAQQRAKLKANRISAPGTLVNENGRPNTMWTSSSLSQVAERAPSPSHTGDLNTSSLSPSPAPSSSSVRPKSTDFTGLANQFGKSPRPSAGTVTNDNATVTELDLHMQDLRLQEQLSPMMGGNWASMVNTPLVPMFSDGAAVGNTSTSGSGSNLDAAAAKLANWSMSNNNSNRVVLDDAKKFRRNSKPTPATNATTSNTSTKKDDSDLLAPGGRNGNNNNLRNNANSSGGWRSPALSTVSSTRFGGSDADANSAASFNSPGFNNPAGLSPGMPGLGMGGMGGFNMFGGMGMMNGMGGMGMASPIGMGMGGMGIQPGSLEAQILAAQLAAGGSFSPGMNGGFGVVGQPGGPANMGAGQGNSRSTRGGGGGNNNNQRSGGGAGNKVSSGNKDKEEDFDPAVLGDVPTWLRTLRLHKYTPNFEGMTWKEMVTMDDDQLEKIGVSALGARRKMLKTFEVVRAKMGVEGPDGSSPPPSAD